MKKHKAIALIAPSTIRLNLILCMMIVFSINLFAQTRSVSGTVKDASGVPLIGVSVQLKGDAKVGTITDVEGRFALSVPANSSLNFSYMGYTSLTLPANQVHMNVILAEDTKKLDEVVVIGYGTQRKANLTGSVGSVNGKTLNSRPVVNAANLIEGRISGLQVTQPSSEPGRDNPTMLIRGKGSFGGSNDPLILIDGVTGSMNNLSPGDIENVTLLKDAASASIYGARAANGVILVTTRKGTKGSMTVNYSGNFSLNTPTALPDLITNSAEYMEMYNAAATRQGVAFKYAQTEIDKYRNATDRNQYPNFNSIDHYFNPAFVMNHNLSITGGGDKNLFNCSLGYLDQKAMLPGYKYKKYNALLNYTNELNKYVTVNTVVNMTYKDRHEPPFTGQNLALSVYAAGPLYGPFLPDGSGRVVSRAYLNEGRNRNPQEYYAMGYQNTKEYNLNAQASIDVKPFPGFVWSSKVAVNYVDEYYKMYQKPYQAYLLQERDATTGDNVMSTYGPDILGVTDQYAKTITPTLFSTFSYETKIKEDHSLKILAGYEQLSYKYQSLRGRRTSTASTVIEDITGYTSTGESLFFTHPRLPAYLDPSEWAMQSLFGRINYNFKNRYLLETNFRYDGTSKVSPTYRWGFFPSASAGWIASEESFLKSVKWLSNLKLRASYGTLGNQDVGTYLYQDNLAINGVYYPFGNTTTSQGAVVNVFKDQSLRWESTSVTDFGLDLNIKNGLFGMTFDWFNKKTFNILAAQPVPASLGLSSPTLNDGEMQNRGIELDIYQ
jgi:TonB-linked SusC/RagA family outer membrane protein